MRARGVEDGGMEMESGGRSRTQDRAQPRLQHSPANSGPLLLAAQTTTPAPVITVNMGYGLPHLYRLD